MNTRVFVLSLLALGFTTVDSSPAQNNEQLKKALGDDSIADDWIYDDIQAGYAAAAKSGKPLLVAFR